MVVFERQWPGVAARIVGRRCPIAYAISVEGLVAVCAKESPVIDWLYNLPVAWMALVVFAGTYLSAGVIYWVVMALAVGERARAFKAMSPGMLSPLGILFGLMVGFVAAQVWSDVERAKA